MVSERNVKTYSSICREAADILEGSPYRFYTKDGAELDVEPCIANLRTLALQLKAQPLIEGVVIETSAPALQGIGTGVVHPWQLTTPLKEKE